MSEFRRDPIMGRWSIIETTNPLGPGGFDVVPHAPGAGNACPFCEGNEGMTPPERYAIRPTGTAPNSPGWTLRVVTNKFPALTSEGELDHRRIGLFDLYNGVGAHEVIIDTPDHHRQMADLTPEEFTRSITAFQARSLDLRRDPRLKYTLLFKNYGFSAGASLEHMHTQLIALPIVPKRVQEELRGSKRYFERTQRCPYCDMLDQDLKERERIICQNASFMAICPFASGMPFELWVLPKVHQSDFAKITEQGIADLGQILKESLLRIRTALSDPAYNFIIHTAPIEPQERKEYHWHLELVPKLTNSACSAI